jgi:hypothetical protein
LVKKRCRGCREAPEHGNSPSAITTAIRRELLTAKQDPEAQKSGLLPLTASVSVSTSEYQRTGRGGVGNFVSNPITGSNELPSKTIAAPIIPSQKKIEYRGHSGRGGAGNWRQVAEEEKRQAEDEEQRARNKVDEQVRADVDKGLQPPPRAYGSSTGR